MAERQVFVLSFMGDLTQNDDSTRRRVARVLRELLRRVELDDEFGDHVISEDGEVIARAGLGLHPDDGVPRQTDKRTFIYDIGDAGYLEVRLTAGGLIMDHFCMGEPQGNELCGRIELAATFSMTAEELCDNLLTDIPVKT